MSDFAAAPVAVKCVDSTAEEIEIIKELMGGRSLDFTKGSSVKLLSQKFAQTPLL